LTLKLYGKIYLTCLICLCVVQIQMLNSVTNMMRDLEQGLLSYFDASQ